MLAEIIKYRRLELGFTTTKLSEIVGVSQSTISSWERGESKPSQLNLAKLLLALEWNQDVRFHLLQLGENEGKVRLTLTDEFYDLLHELEDEFGDMTQVPEDDKRLFELRVMVGAETKESQGYDKKKVDRVRSRHNISRRDFSVALGHSPGWFMTSFLNGVTVFTRKQALEFAEFFGVDEEEFKE